MNLFKKSVELDEELDDLIETPEFDESDQLNEITELSKKGYLYLKEHQFDEAKNCFNEIVQLDENNNYALVGLGDLARKQRHHHEALSYYEKCLDLHPHNNYALFGIADCYKALHQFDKAIEIWEHYLQKDPENITVLTRVADAYRKVKNFKLSKEVYFSVLEKNSDNAYALIGLGHLHYDFREYKDALRFWERMYDIKKDEIDIRVLTSIGNCHRKLKTFTNGVDYFKKALVLDPHNFYALFGLADCYRGMNEHEKSLTYWLEILENDPHNKVILTRAGDALRNLERYDKAIDYYNQALDIEYDTYAILGLSLIHKATKNYDTAITSFSRLIQSDTKNHRFYTELAECYYLNGQKQEALKVLEDFQRFGIRNIYVIRLLEKINQS